MPTVPRKVVSVNTSDLGSGAERVAFGLFKALQWRGAESWLVVGDKKTADPFVLPFFASPHVDYTAYQNPDALLQLETSRARDLAAGVEDFNFPYSRLLPELTGSPPDLFFCHNLHGGYFDLRVLPELSHRFPVVYFLHDCWALTGHCAYPVGCSKWETGCGACPDLNLPPAVAADATDFNWARKRDVFAAARLFVTAPTQWLLDRAKRSVLAPAMADARVIPAPLDTRCFRPAPKAEARAALGLPPHAHILVFAAFQAKSNMYKDCATIEAAVHKLADLMPGEDVLCVALGEEARETRHGRLHIRFLSFQSQASLIRYLQAADVFLHAAKEENFGLVTAESQACGTPVVSTAVGGLLEVIADGERGFLVPPGDAGAMAVATHRLLTDPALRHRLGAQAAAYAARHWDQERVLDTVLDWVAEPRLSVAA